MKIKCLSIKQPYCDQIDFLEKKIEYRNWKTNYRGPILICSSKKPEKGFESKRVGETICIVDLIDIVSVDNDKYKYGWKVKKIITMPKINIKGSLGLFKLKKDLFYSVRDYFYTINFLTEKIGIDFK